MLTKTSFYFLAGLGSLSAVIGGGFGVHGLIAEDNSITTLVTKYLGDVKATTQHPATKDFSPEYSCVINSFGKGNEITFIKGVDCTIYKMSLTEKQNSTPKLNPTEADLLKLPSDLVEKNFYQIKLHSKYLKEFGNVRSLRIDVINKTDTSVKIPVFYSLFEFKKEGNVGQSNIILAQVKVAPDCTSHTNTSTTPTYTLETNIKGRTDNDIRLFNLKDSSTNKLAKLEDFNPVTHFLGLNGNPTKQIKCAELKKDLFLIAILKESVTFSDLKTKPDLKIKLHDNISTTITYLKPLYF